MIEQYKKQENLLEDYGINTYLLNLNTEIHKILESNTILKKENNTLKDRILGLESNISTLIENNKDLVNIIKILEKKEETQKNTEIIDKKVYVENKIDIKNQETNLNDKQINILEKDKTMEDCPFDSNEFLETTIVEKLYKSKNDMEMEKNKVYKEIEVQYCSSCKEYFIKEEVQKKIDLYMNVIPVKAIIIPAVEPVEAVESEFFLNERSPLRIKGYHTGLNDNERWNILKGCCIPELGASRVLYYLEGFVTRFSRQKKDYSNSIRVWKKDIIKVRKYIDDLKK